jgi:hypothetical protein
MNDTVIDAATPMPEAGLDENEIAELISLSSPPDDELAVSGARLFVPELVLGPGAVARADEIRIVEHLVEVATGRTAPLHAAVAWNCLYFDYRPGKGYDDRLVGRMELPILLPNRRQKALPIGALVEWSSGTKDPRLNWAEVVYKEGRPPDALEEGFDGALVKAEYSGVIAFPEGSRSEDSEYREAIVDELLVLDFAPFGSLDDDDQKWLERARTSERSYIDRRGHVRIEASYTPAEEAQCRDAQYFCYWMVDNHAPFLAHGHLGAALSGPDDTDVLTEAMQNSLAAVEDIMQRSGRFESWSGYWYLRESYEAHATNFELAGGPADLSEVRNHMTWVPEGRRTAYHGIGPMLEDYGCAIYEGYAKVVIMMNVMLADAVRAAGTADLRLDDAWLFGGTWRAEVQDGLVCPLAEIDPTVPLGLGAADEFGDHHEPRTDDEGEDEDDELVEDGQPVFWTVGLTHAMHEKGRIWVKASAELIPRADGTVVLRIEHDSAGSERVQRLRLSEDGRWVEGVTFPLDFFDGIRLHCLARRGSDALQATTIPLGGLEAGLRYEFDPSIVDPRRAPRRPPTLVDLSVRIIDRHGEALPDGWRHLPAERIARYLFGPEGTQAGAEAIDAALEGGGERVWRDPDGWWAHRRFDVARPIVSPELDEGTGGFFDGASDKLRASFEGAAAYHRAGGRVVMHQRRLRHGEHLDPTYRARRMELYRKARELAPNRDALEPELLPGYTFVIEHWRGGT